MLLTLSLSPFLSLSPCARKLISRKLQGGVGYRFVFLTQDKPTAVGIDRDTFGGDFGGGIEKQGSNSECYFFSAQIVCRLLRLCCSCGLCRAGCITSAVQVAAAAATARERPHAVFLSSSVLLHLRVFFRVYSAWHVRAHARALAAGGCPCCEKKQYPQHIQVPLPTQTKRFPNLEIAAA